MTYRRLMFDRWLFPPQARSRKTEENEPYVASRRRPEYRSAFHNAAAFYSKSKSFLKLKQLSNRLPCDKDASVQAQYIIQGDELKTGQELLHFYYLVGAMVAARLVLLNSLNCHRSPFLCCAVPSLGDVQRFSCAARARSSHC